MDKGVPNMTEDERMRQIASIGDSMAKMRLMVGRRYIGRLAVARVGAGMELSHLDTLVLVRRLSETQEVTIGAIAAQMRIDHSRASRIVAELVQRGQLHRDASQQDARRTIVTLTDSGSEILSKMRDVKQESLTHALSDWSEQDLDDFARLYERFMQRMHEQSMAFEDANTGKSST